VIDLSDSSPLPPSVQAVLASPETWAQPPADLRERLHAAVVTGSAAVPLTRRRSRLAPLVAAAAGLVLLVALAIGLVVTRSGSPAPVATGALTATSLAPGASGSATVHANASGFRITLDVHGLRPAPNGYFYEAWLKDPAGHLVAVGTFHARQGGKGIVLWSGVDPHRYTTMTVTLQQEGSVPVSSGRVVLKGPLHLRN
jgi:hypothetical protein